MHSYGLMKMGADLLMLLLLAHCVMSAPMVRRDVDDGVVVESTSLDTWDGQMEYLERYAWLGPANPNPAAAGLTDAQQIVDAVREFQRFAGLNMTGEIDEATVKKMAQPRCGVQDNDNMAIQNRRKRYAVQGSRWNNPELSYRINSNHYTPDLHPTEVDNIVKQAFNVWSEVTPLKFSEKSWGDVDIDIEFRSGTHGDGNPFDGNGGTLAHAFFPEFGGDAHFDESESWSHETYDGTNLLQVAVHEFGHSLGLSHSDVKPAIMAPFYGGYEPDIKLHDDDIRAIQAIYGKKPSVKPPVRTTTTPSTPTVKTTRATTIPDICKDGAFDAITNTEDLINHETATFAFRGDRYLKLTNNGVEKGYPRQISDDWPGLPNNLDAALYWPSSSLGTARTYFFKGGDYYKYETSWGVNRLLDGYPKKIASGFSGIPDNLDASFVWSGNGKTYFIKGDKYYRYRRGSGLDQGYPRALNLWAGLPSRIDAAFAWTNGKTYFFDGPNYYRFNDNVFNVDSGYPRLNSIWWLGCPDQSGNSEVEIEETEMASEVENSFRDVETVGDSGSGAAMNYSLSMPAVVLLMTSLIRAFV